MEVCRGVKFAQVDGFEISFRYDTCSDFLFRFDPEKKLLIVKSSGVVNVG